ncbi:hypothetical protein DH2020_020277 [Rehmannia glutinosa]|uniref:SWIM-type domain-containing protein n=1 Tax=Rehmannia glutinosa TaxID=99300 RepID=A0ABR0WFM7_REHGL
MTSWLTYQCKNSLPPCPIIDEDDVQLLICVNTNKFLSAPLCLVTKLKDYQVSTQSKREQNESESSNNFEEAFDPIGTAEHFYDYKEEAELEPTDPIFYDDSHATFYKCSRPERVEPPVESPRRHDNDIPIHENDLPPPLNQTAIYSGYEGGPSFIQNCTSKSLKYSIRTGHSCVGIESATPNTTSDSVSIDNDLHVDQVFHSKDEIIRRFQIISMIKNREYKTKKSDQGRFILPFKSPTHVYPPAMVISELKQALGVDIGYEKAWRAREEALKLVGGTPDDSFKKLTAYFHRLKEVNPDTITHIEIDGDGNFKYYYMCLGQSLHGFGMAIRHVLAVDETHLKGKYRYRHANIQKGVKDVFPNAHHRFCIYHLRQNVVAKFEKVVDISTLLLCATKTYDEAVHRSCIRQILVVDEVYNYLTCDAKDPPVSLLDTIVTKLSDWFSKCRDVACKMNGPFTTCAEKQVLKRDELARRFNIRTLHHYTYEVLDGHKIAVVDVNRKTCTCQKFHLDQLACAHALETTSKINFSKYGMTSPYYIDEYLYKHIQSQYILSGMRIIGILQRKYPTRSFWLQLCADQEVSHIKLG